MEFSMHEKHTSIRSKEDYIVLQNGKLITDKKRVANLFNNYFINIIENSTGKKLNHPILDPLTDPIDQITETYKNLPIIVMINEKMSVTKV